VGDAVYIPDPQYGVAQDRVNFQVVQQLAGGGFYVHDGEKPRSFDLGWNAMLRETYFDDLDEIYSVVGQDPVAVLVSDYLNNDMKWCGYFHIMRPPQSKHAHPTRSSVSLELREAV